VPPSPLALRPGQVPGLFIKERKNKDNYSLNLGAAFPHEEGEGFNLLLQALPLDGKIVLSTYKDDEAGEKMVEAKLRKIRRKREVALRTQSLATQV
jgi:hypothetical protein